ncbi:hypothetical protein Tco_1549044 [Tanacetum coccineum]
MQLCFVHDPIQRSWHWLNLERVPSMTRPVSTIGGQGLILFKSTGGLIQLWASGMVLPNTFQAVLAGGDFEAANGGAASYEPTLEVFNSKSNKWTVMGSMPVEFAVRVTTVLKRKVGSSTLPNDWKGIIDALVKLNNDNAIRSILRNERNKRLFDKESRNILVYNQNAAATRNAKLIGALQKFVGPDVKAFLSHVKPALLSAVEAL